MDPINMTQNEKHTIRKDSVIQSRIHGQTEYGGRVIHI
jgi:hypothetical protein